MMYTYTIKHDQNIRSSMSACPTCPLFGEGVF